MREMVLGIDVGAETIKLVLLAAEGAEWRWVERRLVEHEKDPAGALRRLLAELDWSTIVAAAATGRVSRLLRLDRVPTKGAAAAGVRFLYPDLPTCTCVSIGSHGFYVLELREHGYEVVRENSRCSQGTGNFLRQLVERFDLDVEEASRISADVTDPAPLSGRCPVILKTDMTHLANKGEARPRILAGLYDAVCENVQVLVKPEVSPPDTLLVGGVARAPRIRAHFAKFLAGRGMRLHPGRGSDDLFIEALGAALVAAERRFAVPAPHTLVKSDDDAVFESLPALSAAQNRVHRMTAPPLPKDAQPRRVVLGFDMGSTGSKAVAVDATERRPLWEGYLDTRGNPVGAAHALARRFLDETGGRHDVAAVGATGSGREIVGSLMATCFGAERVFVLNEIAAHAEGALFFDPQVDTIFEIGGQDAKYVRLDAGRIADAAMNEACSAGTGSFIAEQGRKFRDIRDVVHLGEVALAAERGISLGQHCSVFMAEVIDAAVASGVEQPAIIAGIYDAIIQNYLNRVKGNRSVGQRIFCQGMPFASDALAAAVVRQTGADVIVPPNPGTIGALGIALLAAKEVARADAEPLNLEHFLSAEVTSKDTFVCGSTKGCGGSGNRCRIDRLRVSVAGAERKFLWGGNCSLYDAGTRRRKLPDRAPDPFHERAQLQADLLAPLQKRTGRPLVALTDEFTLKGLLPFFATYLDRLGFDLQVFTDAGQKLLKRGIEVANVPYCAPLQMFHGIVAEMAAAAPDYLLIPMLRELPRSSDEPYSTTCPMVQASPDLVVPLVALAPKTQILAPRIDMGPGNLASPVFAERCAQLAAALGVPDERWRVAFAEARRVQDRFEADCLGIGRRALGYARERNLVAVVVLGRMYTIYNTVLNSNVPNLLREQGAIAIPVDCFPVDPEVPVFRDVYWGYSQSNLRVAHQVRRMDGVYSVFCSNYSCGPDSFNLHFYTYIMQNKPFAIIETDGHSGDAGTKTRIEAFLYCVEGDRRLSPERRQTLPRTNFKSVETRKIDLYGARQREELIAVPPMSASAPIIAACLRAEGMRAEVLPLPDAEALRLGRKYTSGKECVPMTITLGSMLQRVARDPSGDERFAFFMPTAHGPCRFGVYNLLHKIVFEHLGLKDRIQIVAPEDSDYFAGLPADFQVRAFSGFMAADLLEAALHDVRPVEREPGAAQAVFDHYYAELVRLTERLRGGELVRALGELAGDAFGMVPLIEEAASEFASLKDFSRDVPTVSMVGEIYCRLDPFANGFIIDHLERRGLRVTMAPFTEWLEYTTHLQRERVRSGRPRPGDQALAVHTTAAVQAAVAERFYGIMGGALRWAPRTTVKDSLAAAEPYLSADLTGEAVLTLGGPVHEFLHGHVSGAVAVGPHECMPAKIAEAQYAHVTEERGLVVLNLPLNGDPLDSALIDNFAFDVHQFHARQRKAGGRRPAATPARRISPVAGGSGARPPLVRMLDSLAAKGVMRSLGVLRPLSKPLGSSLQALRNGLGLNAATSGSNGHGGNGHGGNGNGGNGHGGNGHGGNGKSPRTPATDLRWPVTDARDDVPRV